MVKLMRVVAVAVAVLVVGCGSDSKARAPTSSSTDKQTPSTPDLVVREILAVLGAAKQR